MKEDLNDNIEEEGDSAEEAFVGAFPGSGHYTQQQQVTTFVKPASSNRFLR